MKALRRSWSHRSHKKPDASTKKRWRTFIDCLMTGFLDFVVLTAKVLMYFTKKEKMKEIKTCFHLQFTT